MFLTILNSARHDHKSNAAAALQAIAMAQSLGDDAELVKQLSNRAAARLMLAQLREALADCQEALQVKAPLTSALDKLHLQTQVSPR